jgi:hypothetical protein
MSLVNVYFTYTDRKYWWTRLLKPGFSHVFITIPCEGGRILVDPNFGHLVIKFIKKYEKLPQNLQKQVILVNFRTDVNLKGGWFRPVTCVEIIKRALGIRKPLIFSPYQLYRYILWVAHQNHQNQPQHKMPSKPNKEGP